MWNTATGRREWAVHSGHTRKVTALAVSPDGTWVATVSDDQTVQTFDARSGRLRDRHAAGPARAIVIAPDGTWYATAGTDGTVRTWYAKSGTARSALSTGQVSTLAIAPDGSWMATADREGTVRTWDTEPRAVVTQDAGQGGGIRALAVTDDGRALTGVGTGLTARSWDLQTGHATTRRLDATGQVTAAVASPEGGWIATADENATIRTWDCVTGDPRWSFSAQTAGPLSRRGRDQITAMAVAAGSRWLATMNQENRVRLWHPRTGEQHPLYQAAPIVANVLAFAPDLPWLITARHEKITIYDVDAGTRNDQVPDITRSNLTCLAVSRGGYHVACGFRGHIQLWHLERRRSTLLDLDSNTVSTTAVAFSPDGTWLAATDTNGNLQIWPVTGGRPAAMMRLDGPGLALLWAPDGTVIVGAEVGPYAFRFELIPNRSANSGAA
jgi:WD40 repeat protein